MKKATKKKLIIGGGIVGVIAIAVLVYYFFFYKKKEEGQDTEINASPYIQKKISTKERVKLASNPSLKPNVGVPFASDVDKAYIPFKNENLSALEYGANQAYEAYVNDTNRSKWTPEQLASARSHAARVKTLALRDNADVKRKADILAKQIADLEAQLNS